MADSERSLSFREILGVQIPRMAFEGANVVDIESVLGSAVDENTLREGWTSKAKNYEELAMGAEANGHRTTSRMMYLQASVCYRLAQFHHYADTEQKRELLQKCISCYQKAAVLFDPPIIRVEIPFKGVKIPGYLHLPTNAADNSCVICVDGLGICKEEFHNWCRHGVERGMAALVFDGPGYGETRTFQGLKLDIDLYVELLSAAVDYLQGRSEIAPERIGMLGDCFGAYLACRAAALEKRFKACALIEGFYSVRDAQMENVPPSGFALITYIFGEEYAQRFRTFGMPLESIDARITCPLYIVHAREDRWIDISLAQKIYEEAEGPKQFEVVEEKAIFKDYNLRRYNTVLDQLYRVVPATWDWLQTQLERR